MVTLSLTNLKKKIGDTKNPKSNLWTTLVDTLTDSNVERYQTIHMIIIPAKNKNSKRIISIN